MRLSLHPNFKKNEKLYLHSRTVATLASSLVSERLRDHPWLVYFYQKQNKQFLIIFSIIYFIKYKNKD